ncbi:MAG: hypothetical protein PHN51_07965 [Candidatus Nanopelagicales bacterium]|nr:hypothetical protein [Candidatus Nanopelagicales bacterium]
MRTRRINDFSAGRLFENRLGRSALVVYGAYRLGLWSVELTKDTVIVIVFAGLPLVFAAGKFDGGKQIMRKVATEVLGISALLVVYLSLALFPLWAEILLQSLLLILVMLVTVGARQASTAKLTGCLNAIVASITLGVAIYVALQVYWNFGSYDWTEEARTFALSIWLPIALIPFVYIWGFRMACELTLLRVRWQGEDRSVPRRVQLAIVLGFLGSLRYATRFKLHWIGDLARETSFRGAWRAMREFRRAVRVNRRAERARKARLERFAGVVGLDSAGLQLDRREFHETKDGLIDVYYTQSGYFSQHRRYESDAEAIFRLSLLSKLPDEHQIQFRVSKDRRTWRAWRQTPAGYVFAVGGTKDINQEWRFDGDDPPEDFPRQGGRRWRDMMIEDESPEWAKDDAPIPDA